MFRSLFVAIAGVSFAIGGVAAAENVDWEAVAEEQTVEVFTTNEDGSVRETTVWLVVVDGQGFLRTSRTRWGGNIERDPKVVLAIAGTEYPLLTQRVTDPELHGRVMARFREKYGFSDRFIGWVSVLSGKRKIYRLQPWPETERLPVE